MSARILHGDCLQLLQGIPDCSVDSVVTDAPYGLGKPPPLVEVLTAWIAGKPWKAKGRGFMGHEWDAFVPGPEIWKECLRVLKPGGHLLCFAGPRTQHMMGLAIALAGFEIRDCFAWIFGSGMPKGQDVSAQIDALLGYEREVVGSRVLTGSAAQSTKEKGGTYGANTDSVGVPGKEVPITAPASAEAKRWEGWKPNMKPAVEPIILARKPLKQTVAKNVLEHGTGALNIDACRIETTDDLSNRVTGSEATVGYGGRFKTVRTETHPLGRWPANVLLDEDAAAELDGAIGNRPGMSGGGKHKVRRSTIAGGGHDGNDSHIRGDSGGPSRFFYTSKVNKKERHAGLVEFLPRTKRARKRWQQDESGRWLERAKNDHPTLKPQDLLRWLCRLATQSGGTVLDPFAGSGSTGCAALREGFDFIGCELDARHVVVARARIEYWKSRPGSSRRAAKRTVADDRQLSLLGAS